VYKSAKDVLQNLLPVWLLVRKILFSIEPFLDYLYKIWHLLSALYSDVRKKIYRCTSALSALNYCSGIFSNPSAIYTKWCAQTFLPISGLFAIFVCNLAKNMAPSGNGNRNSLAILKGQSILRKTQTASKSTHKPWHNTCSNYVTLQQTARRPWSVAKIHKNMQTSHFRTYSRSA